jgi:hypothetical protein
MFGIYDLVKIIRLKIYNDIINLKSNFRLF